MTYHQRDQLWILWAVDGESPHVAELVSRYADRLQPTGQQAPAFHFASGANSHEHCALIALPYRPDSWQWRRPDGSSGRTRIVRADSADNALRLWRK